MGMSSVNRLYVKKCEEYYLQFFATRRYATAVYTTAVSVCPSVCMLQVAMFYDESRVIAANNLICLTRCSSTFVRKSACMAVSHKP